MDIQQTPAAKKTFYPIPLSEEVEVELDFTQWFESLYAFNQNFLSEIRDAQLEDKPKPQKKRKRKQLGYRVYNVPGGERQLCIRNASICSEEQIRDLWKKNKITALSVIDHKITQEALCALMKQAGELGKDLHDLTFSGNTLEKEAFEHLASLIEERPSICELGIERIPLNIEKIKMLGKAVLKPSIEHLDLFSMELNDTSLEGLIKVLGEDCSLKHLSLGMNEITSAPMEKLAKLLNSHPTFKCVQLNGNQIGFKGAKKLIKTIDPKKEGKIFLKNNPIKGDEKGLLLQLAQKKKIQVIV
ncbi:MAG: hypothetical protein CMO81_00560 [Waddliaceae bacterium]|nr:hypothetical protein [Waddliaceae bacterium]